MNGDRSWPWPFVQRLRRHLEGLEGPVVWLWGWPGSGRRLLIRGLAQEGSTTADLVAGELVAGELVTGELREVAPGLLLDGRALAAVARRARRAGQRWLACRRPPRAIPPETFDHLRLEIPLLLVCEELPEVLEGDVVGPAEWLLDIGEVADLWRSVAGRELEPDTAEAWLRAASGWYRPLRLAAEAVASGRPVVPDIGALGRLPAVAAFVETRVLAPLPAPMAQLLRRRAGGEAMEPGLAPPALTHRAWRHGWALDDREDLPPLPPLLAARPSARAASKRQAATPRSFDVQLLGSPRLTSREDAGGAVEISWSLQRSLRLFAFLASAPGRRASKDELVEALFPGSDEEQIRRNFHPTLSHLRRDLGGGRGSDLRPVLYGAGIYELDPGLEWRIDLERFEGHRAAAEERRRIGDQRGLVEHLKAAWSLYRGPFLQGIHDPWVVPRREALHRAYLRLLRELGQVSGELGDLEQSLDAYRAVLVEDPLEETVQTAILRIYAAQGRRDLVRRQYDRLCTLLLEELGVEPLPETTAEYHRLMA